MKRKKQIIGCILIIGLLCFMHIRVQDLFFTPEGVFTAYEEGHHREPYKGIVLAYETDYGKMLVGQQPDGLLFTPVEQVGPLWKLREQNTHGLHKMNNDLNGLIVDWKHCIGVCRDPEVVEVTCVYGQWQGEPSKLWALRDSSGPVDENGVFMLEVDLAQYEPAGTFLEGRNAEGEIICTYGFDESLIKDAREGNVIWLEE